MEAETALLETRMLLVRRYNDEIIAVTARRNAGPMAVVILHNDLVEFLRLAISKC